MSIGTFIQPDFETQGGTAYKSAIDNCFAVLTRIGAMFAPHEQAIPDMTVRVDAGAVLVNNVLTEVAAQSTGTITAPTGTDHRIDRVVIADDTGVVSVITGTPGAEPCAIPAITTGKLPICQVALAHGMTVITNDLITDERIGMGGGGAEAFPVGAIYLSVTGVNPATELGYGTWAAFGTGRMLVGIDAGQTEFDTVEETGGAKTKNLAHTHTTPAHAHALDTPGATPPEGAKHTVDAVDSSYHGTNSSGSGNTGSGLSATQDVMNPYIVVYMWKRVS